MVSRRTKRRSEVSRAMQQNGFDGAISACFGVHILSVGPLTFATPVVDSYCFHATTPHSMPLQKSVKGKLSGRMFSCLYASRRAKTRRSDTQRRHRAAKRARRPSDTPDWLNEKTYRERIQPRLAEVTAPAISTALGIP
jgi:hypothetical protein